MCKVPVLLLVVFNQATDDGRVGLDEGVKGMRAASSWYRHICDYISLAGTHVVGFVLFVTAGLTEGTLVWETGGR